jgi:predicted nucleotidyltransferase
LEIRYENARGQDLPLLEGLYLKLEPFTMPFEMLEKAVGTRLVEKDGVSVRRWALEDHLVLEPDSLTKVLELLSIMETKALFGSALGMELQDLML